MLKIHHAHPWDVSPREARDIQSRLRPLAERTDRFGKIRYVAGVDAGFDKHRGLTRAAVSVLRFPTLEVVEEQVHESDTTFPYVPGLLSFREVPAVLEVLGMLTTLPQLLICDGQGRAHPRRFGLACHLGLLTDIPCIGVAKTRLLGTHDPVAEERGAYAALMDRDEVIGAVLRTRQRVSPVYVSEGHRVSLISAISLTLTCAPRYRLPETTRRADRLASTRKT